MGGMGSLVELSDLQRAQIISHAVPRPVWLLDLDLRIAWVSPAVEQTHGFTLAELREIPFQDQMTPESLERARALAASWLTPEKLGDPRAQVCLEAELELRHKDGTSAWSDVLFTLQRDAEGKPTGYICISWDIDQRKRSEVRLDAERKMLMQMLDGFPSAVYLINDQCDLIYVNPVTESIFGVVGSFAGQKCYRYLHNREEPCPWCNNARVFGQGETVHWSGRSPANGRYYDLHDTPIRDSSGRLLKLEVGHDITELKRIEEDNAKAYQELRRSEARYRSLVENLDDVVFTLDAEQRLTFVSSAARKYGYSPEELIGRPFGLFLHPEDLPAANEAFARALAGAGAPTEFRLIDKEGRPRHTRSVSRAEVEHGQTLGVRGVLVDLTKQRQTEEQLRLAQKMEAVGRLAGGVAHDFNNLLTVINSYTDLVLGSVKPNSPSHAELVEVRRAGERAEALTRQLLAFSRRQVLQPELVDLNGLVAATEKMLGRVIGEDIELTVELSTERGVVRVDPGQIEQVIMNLAVNARDAMPRGGKLLIETAAIELGDDEARQRLALSPGPYVVLSVSDTGTGIDDETKARIFEPFFTTKHPDKGTGLGLATVYGIVQQSGGAIFVYSEVGVGTTFKVYLPREQGATAAVRTSARRPVILPATGGEVVLVVEDNDSVRTLTRRILSLAGYTVLTAADGEEAIRLSEDAARKVDLLVTDVVMPGCDGRELASRLRGTWPELRVLYMSGYTDHAIVEHHALEPDAHFLAKPFSAEALSTRAREALSAPPAKRRP